MSLRTQFIALDDALAAEGVPPLTEWWREGIGRWLDAYERDHVLELLACVGRGAAKSTALYKLALFFSLFGDFAIPPGERHFAIVLSRLKEEAAKGIAIIAAWLSLLGWDHRVSGDVLELVDLPRGIRVVAASVAATSGWRAYFVGRDERSKWATDGSELLDAEEVDTSATAMTATHSLAPMPSFGSAWGALGGFYEAVTAGSNDRRTVLGPTPTWIAAPHISEASTRRKESDPRRWAREYACQFQQGAFATFDATAVGYSFEPREVTDYEAAEPIIVLDPSSGRADAWAWGVCRYMTNEKGRWMRRGDGEIREWPDGSRRGHPDWKPAGHPILRFELVDSREGAFWAQISGETLVAQIIALARSVGARQVHSDQRESLLLRAAIERGGLQFHEHPWTSGNKVLAVESLRRSFRDRTIWLPTGGKGEALRQELLRFEERISASGSFTYGGRSSHDDLVALLMTAAMADSDPGLPSSPNHRTFGGPIMGQNQLTPF